MRYCSTATLKPGMVLAKPIYSDKNHLLLGVGNKLTDSLITRIRDMRLPYICIEERGTEKIVIEDIIDEQILRQSKSSLQKVFEKIILDTRRYNEKSVDDLVKKMEAERYVAPIGELISNVRVMITELERKPELVWDTLPPHFTKDTWFHHGVDVAMVALLLGLKYKYDYNQLTYLGLGAMLHDIGIAFLPKIAQKRRCDYTNEEKVAYMSHPQYGASLLEHHSSGHYVAKECLLQHHEHQDGHGFPQGLKGKNVPPLKQRKYELGEIYRYAEIVTVADAFINLVTGGWYENIMMPDNALAVLQNDVTTVYNLTIVMTLKRLVEPFPVGASVRISQNSSSRFIGHCGVIEKTNRQEPHKPTIIIYADSSRNKIEPKRIDFADEGSMKIQMDM